ncbi:unnamed protein product [Pleuronectes platessa]|uniref:Uncharacterized protein n=1 Tax=Pleuronectes platessa TaxID=8262 RepID=A0A9N7UJG6_PLEPL|nr:unnamed protein product [Pleuronectes platessa]
MIPLRCSPEEGKAGAEIPSSLLSDLYGSMFETTQRATGSGRRMSQLSSYDNVKMTAESMGSSACEGKAKPLISHDKGGRREWPWRCDSQTWLSDYRLQLRRRSVHASAVFFPVSTQHSMAVCFVMSRDQGVKGSGHGSLFAHWKESNTNSPIPIGSSAFIVLFGPSSSSLSHTIKFCTAK